MAENRPKREGGEGGNVKPRMDFSGTARGRCTEGRGSRSSRGNPGEGGPRKGREEERSGEGHASVSALGR